MVGVVVPPQGVKPSFPKGSCRQDSREGKEASLSGFLDEDLSHGWITGLFFKIVCVPSCFGKRERGATGLLVAGLGCT